MFLAQRGDERPLHALCESTRLVTPHREIDMVEELAKIRQRIAGVAIFPGGKLEQPRVFGRAQVIRLHTTYLAAVNPVEMDRHKQVSALGVRQGSTLAQWDCLVLVSRHHHLKGSLFEQRAQA
jgi:hypothetical protein